MQYSVVKFNDVKNIFRFDAKYFQPKYEEIIEEKK